MMLCKLLTFLTALALSANAFCGEGKHPYPFSVQPHDALKLVVDLRQYSDRSDYEPSPVEAEMVKSLRSADMTQREWADSFLIASGECSSTAREKHLNQLDELTRQLEKLTVGRSAIEKGEIILKHLHSSVMSKGYHLDQSSLASLLDTGKFNCVSSTVLYQILCERLGLQLKLIEFEGSTFSIGHVLALVVDSGKSIDVETTNPEGFDIRAKIAKGGGFSVGIKNLRDGREIDVKGLLKVVYNNRYVDFEKSHQNFDAIRILLTMLMLDPDSAEQQKNIEGAFANWLFYLNEKQKHSEAIAVGRVGLAISPDASAIHHNIRVVHNALASNLIATGDDRGVAELYKTAVENWPKQEYEDEFKSAFERAAQSASKSGQWESAIAILNRGAAVSSGKIHSEMERECRKYYRIWSQDELKAGNFHAASQVLRQAIAIFPSDKELYDGVDFLAQESFERIDSGCDAEKLLTWQLELSSTFPLAKNLPEVAKGYLNRRLSRMFEKNEFERAREFLRDRVSHDGIETLIPAKDATELAARIFDGEARSYFKTKDWEKAASVYKKALDQLPSNSLLLQNAEYVYNEWASISIEKKEWTEAIAVYEMGSKVLPNSRLFQDNKKYCQQFLVK